MKRLATLDEIRSAALALLDWGKGGDWPKEAQALLCARIALAVAEAETAGYTSPFGVRHVSAGGVSNSKELIVRPSVDIEAPDASE